MNSTTVRNIAVTIAAAAITATQLEMARRDRKSHDPRVRAAEAAEQRAQEAHDDHMRWSRGISASTS